MVTFLTKGTVSRDLFSSVSMHESSSPRPPIIALASFRIISKILEDIHNSRCTTGVNNTGSELTTAGVLDGKFTAGVVDAGSHILSVI
jgi:hypothetical protein